MFTFVVGGLFLNTANEKNFDNSQSIRFDEVQLHNFLIEFSCKISISSLSLIKYDKLVYVICKLEVKSSIYS